MSKEVPNTPDTPNTSNISAEQFIAALPSAEYWIEELLDHPLAKWRWVGGPEEAVVCITDAEVESAETRRLIAASKLLGRNAATGAVISNYGLREHGEPLFITWPVGATPEDVVFFDQGANKQTAPDFGAALELTTLVPGAQPINIEPFDPLTSPRDFLHDSFSSYLEITRDERI